MQAPATLLLRNARVYTGNPAQPWAAALAAVGDRIVWLGDDRAAAMWAGPQTRQIDGGGRLALPGLIDSHFHLLLGARALGQLDLDAATDIADLQRRLRDYAAANPGRAWIVGRGWKYSLFAPGQAIERAILDAAVADRPVLLTAFDGHTAWANSVALERAGIMAGAATGSDFSTVVLGADGQASGELREGPAIDMVRRLIPPMGAAEQDDLLRRALANLAALGVTGVHNMDGDEAQLALYRRFADADELSLRVLLPLSLRPGSPPDQIDAWAELARQQAGPLLRAGAVKLFMDGVVESKTALLLAPYADGSGDLGAANYDQEEFEELVVRADARGLQVLVHAIGDGAVRRTLDGYAAALRANGRRDSRHRVEHVELIDPADVARFVELGVVAAMQPIHANFGLDPHNTWRRLAGPERWPWGFAWRRLRDAGVRIAFGSDWPVASPDPLRGLHVARNRIKLDFSGPASAFPDQRLTLAESVAAYTGEAAYAGHREADLGRLAPGYLADLVLLSQNIFELPDAAIGEARVELTVVGGKVVFAR
jgi:predicted amidohydrolase YtcJ